MMNCSLGELLARVPAGELTEWRAYFRVKNDLMKKAAAEGDVPDDEPRMPKVMGGVS